MPVEPIRTDRLVLRHPSLDDADFYFALRNHPDVAALQDWPMPTPMERVVDGLTKAEGREGPAAGQPFMYAVDRPGVGQIGDLYVGIGDTGRTAEIGFSFDPDHWGHGYATEAASAIVAHLFEHFEVGRVYGGLHPDNVASARVLEACGLIFEGHSKDSYWDETRGTSDDWLYGVTAQAWKAWRDRPRHRPDRVELVEITADTSPEVGRLVTHKSQERFVSPVLASFRDALFPEEIDGALVVPWYRAIEADGDLVGFIMAAELTDAHPDPYLWRFLIDRHHQRRGIGSMALDLFEDECRRWGASGVKVSWVPGAGSPEPMYRARGYEPTGEIDEGEIVARKTL